MNFTKLSLPDLAIAISDYLRKNNINAILTGGACVSVYTQNRFMSEDIDFVLISDDEQPKVKELLEKVGFQFKNGFFRLEQAIMVCRDNPVDLKEVERWSRREGMVHKYHQFIKT